MEPPLVDDDPENICVRLEQPLLRSLRDLPAHALCLSDQNNAITQAGQLDWRQQERGQT